MITRAHCIPYIGQRVIAHTKDGRLHDGILHSVTNDGMYLRPVVAGRVRPVSHANKSDSQVDLLAQMPGESELQEAFFPFFFLPFFALAAFSPWAWWW